jgi:hypothetical protein
MRLFFHNIFSLNLLKPLDPTPLYRKMEERGDTLNNTTKTQ